MGKKGREPKGDYSSERAGSATVTLLVVCAVGLNWNVWLATIDCMEALRILSSPSHRLVLWTMGQRMTLRKDPLDE